MKHGVAFRKFSRTSSHRMLMLRNLVTSLFEHEQIKTTLPKARDTARLAEKIITLGKKGNNNAHTRASAFLLKPIALTNLFKTFAPRYAERPGGYTRIHKFGNRYGDNAPQAILELVDNPRDLRWEMTSRAVGWDLQKHNSDPTHPKDALKILQNERKLTGKTQQGGVLRPKTRWNVQKILKYRAGDAIRQLSEMAQVHADKLLAAPYAYKATYEDMKEEQPGVPIPQRRAGHKRIDDERPALEIARGVLGPTAKPTSGRKRIRLENALHWTPHP